MYLVGDVLQELVGKVEQALYARRKCNGVSPSSPAALSASSQHIVIVEGKFTSKFFFFMMDILLMFLFVI